MLEFRTREAMSFPMTNDTNPSPARAGRPSLDQPRIDIVLPTYNGGPYVRRQVESVLEQMDDRCRLLIRDDCSSDDTRSILGELASRHPSRICLIEDDGTTLGACGNFGRLLEHVDADYVAFCDQDDVWLPGRLALPLARIQTIERRWGRDLPILAHTDLVVVDEDLQVITRSFWDYSRLDPACGNRLNRLLVQNIVTGCATMINRAMVREACPIPKAAAMHDWWLALVASAVGRIEAIAEPTVLYRQHRNNHLGATRYNWRYVFRRSVDFLGRDAMSIWRWTTHQQAVEFQRRFEGRLPLGKRESLAAYVDLENHGFFKRRVQLLKYGFMKTGSLRNFGWLLLS